MVCFLCLNGIFSCIFVNFKVGTTSVWTSVSSSVCLCVCLSVTKKISAPPPPFVSLDPPSCEFLHPSSLCVIPSPHHCEFLHPPPLVHSVPLCLLGQRDTWTPGHWNTVTLKKMINMDNEGTLEGLYLVRVTKNLRHRVHFGVHIGDLGGSIGSYQSIRISKKLLPVVKRA